MIKKVIAILQKHFNKAYDYYNKELDLTGHTAYEIAECHPSYSEFLDCCRELVKEIRGVDLSDMVELPDELELADFIFPFINAGEEQEFWRQRAKDLAKSLITFLRLGERGYKMIEREDYLIREYNIRQARQNKERGLRCSG